MHLMIRGAENDELAVPVNNTLVCQMAFLATDTRPCVLILEYPTSGVVLKLFQPAKVKSVKTGPSFVGVMRLVTALSEGKERLQLRNVWST